MNVLVNITLGGIKKALKDLKKFRKPERIKVFIKALRAAGNTFLKAFRKEAKKHDRSGTFRKALSMKQKYYKNSDTLIIMIGIKSWFAGTYRGKKVVPHKYGHLLLGGHDGFTQQYKVIPGRRYMIRGKSGLVVAKNNSGQTVSIRRRVGAAKGDDFITRIASSHRGQALAAAVAVVKKGLNK